MSCGRIGRSWSPVCWSRAAPGVRSCRWLTFYFHADFLLIFIESRLLNCLFLDFVLFCWAQFFYSQCGFALSCERTCVTFQLTTGYLICTTHLASLGLFARWVSKCLINAATLSPNSLSYSECGDGIRLTGCFFVFRLCCCCYILWILFFDESGFIKQLNLFACAYFSYLLACLDFIFINRSWTVIIY